MAVSGGSSWLVCISCSAQALKSVRAASKYVVQPIVDKIFEPSSTANLARRVVYFWADHGLVNKPDLLPSWFHLSGAIYSHPALARQNIDTRLLLPNNVDKRPLLGPVENIFLCRSPKENLPTVSSLPEFMRRQITISSSPNEIFLPEITESLGTCDCSAPKPAYRQSEEVCLGGTFDQLHAGHKQLLTAGCLACCKRLTIGVTTGPMNEKKHLFEVMEPIEKRIAEVKQFVNDVDPSIEANVVPITDPFGPSTEIENLGVLVVSSETLRGGQRVNEERVKKGLAPANLFVIDLVEHHDARALGFTIAPADEDALDEDVPLAPFENESKVSSSTERFHLLGELLKPPLKHRGNETATKDDPSLRPYVIGLTGGIASGKTSVSHRLQKLGAIIIDCDKLGHEVYKKTNPAFDEIVARFGQGIVDESTGEIDRRELGSIVFKNKDDLRDLCSITWPKIGDLLDEQIEKVAQQCKAGSTRPIIVVNAAVLLEAKWDSHFNEIWLCMVPPEFELKRTMVRDKMSEEAAKERIASQMTNAQRVSRCHVVISTLWRRSVTQYITEKAWKLLQQRV